MTDTQEWLLIVSVMILALIALLTFLKSL